MILGDVSINDVIKIYSIMFRDFNDDMNLHICVILIGIIKKELVR